MTKEELKDLLKEFLTVDVTRGDFFSPNDLTVTILFGGEPITTSTVWMNPRDEYEG
jgi:hypothetical protein